MADTTKDARVIMRHKNFARTKFVYNTGYVAPFVAVPKPHPGVGEQTTSYPLANFTVDPPYNPKAGYAPYGEIALPPYQGEPQYTPINGTGPLPPGYNLAGPAFQPPATSPPQPQAEPLVSSGAYPQFDPVNQAQKEVTTRITALKVLLEQTPQDGPAIHTAVALLATAVRALQLVTGNTSLQQFYNRNPDLEWRMGDVAALVNQGGFLTTQPTGGSGLWLGTTPTQNTHIDRQGAIAAPPVVSFNKFPKPLSRPPYNDGSTAPALPYVGNAPPATSSKLLTTELTTEPLSRPPYKPPTTTVLTPPAPPEPPTPSLPQKRAILIGCNYKDTPNELRGCLNDVNYIYNMIKANYTVTKMTDNIENIDLALRPTRDNIISVLTSLISQTITGDVLLVTYSGHGTSEYDVNNDEKDAIDECIVPCDFNIILDDEFYAIIQLNMKPDTTLIMLSDSCNSGTLLDLKYNYLITESSSTDAVTDMNETSGQVICISGCSDSQTSADAFISGEWRGAMTWALLGTLQENPHVSWKNLILNMRTRLLNSGYSQVVQISSGKPLDLDTQVTL